MIDPLVAKDIIVSGMRPTGRLHLGNYWGALRNWVELQKTAQTYFFVADWHMLTTGYEDTSKLQENTREMVLDWLAAGLDPEKSVIFRQSDVSEHAELAVLLSMITPLSWLENNPTWKEQLQELAKTKMAKAVEAAGSGKVAVEERVEAAESEFALRTHGFLGYPVLQTADVLLYKGTKVPVGQDQLPHLELSRQIARKFNSLFGNVLPEPQPLVTQTPKLPGNDGRKMSKSYGNTIELNEEPESLKTKVMGMYTDPNRVRKTDPGHPEPCPENPPGCVVYSLHKLYNADKAAVEKIGADCRAGTLGCVADKRDMLLPVLEKPFSEFRANRAKYDGKKVDEILRAGAEKARAVAQKTMAEVRRAMRLTR
jgi:tryptophanyl-tRNA synthetase